MIFEYKQYRISYEKWGEGPEVLFAFHGFGQDAPVFKNIAAALDTKYTVYACALFYHGDSRFPDHVPAGAAFLPEQLKAGIEAFCLEENIQKFSLMGYSLGGRIALKLTEMMPERINGLLLLAPDGIKKSFWYHFATNHSVGKKLFNRVVYKPHTLFTLVNAFNSAGIVSHKLKKFVHSQFSDEQNRLKVLHVWNTYSQIIPSVRKVRRIIQEHGLRVLIFTGKYDPVLDPEIGYILQNGLEKFVRWKVIQAGHDLLKPHYVPVIQQELEWL